MTDNRNRTAGDIRSYFNKNNGNLGETGCVGWMFKEQGVISVEKIDINQDELFDAAINAGAEDFVTDEEEDYKIITTPESLQSVAEEIQKAGYKIKSAEKLKTPQNTVPVQDEETAKYLLKNIFSEIPSLEEPLCNSMTIVNKKDITTNKCIDDLIKSN